ncbi:MAG: hypothetical protein AAF385_15385 [Pseudomonadota bacterium]
MCLSIRMIGFALLVSAQLAWATEPNPESADSVKNDTTTTSQDRISKKAAIDEVTVTEKKSVRQLRIALKRADDRVFALYNDLNTDDSLDIICKKETRIESQIKYRVCKTAYHREMESESAQDLLGEGGLGLPSNAPGGHYSNVRSNMKKLMSENPELLRAVYQRSILRKSIAELKKDH